LAFFPDGRLAIGWNAYWPEDDVLAVWNPTTQNLECVFGEQRHPVQALAASPVGYLIAIACHVPRRSVYGNVVRIWDCARSCWRSPVELDPTQPLMVRALCFSPDGQSIATATGRFASIWDIITGNRWCKLMGHTELVNTVCFSPDGRFLATGSKDGTVRLWEVSSGQERAAFDWKTGVVRGVTFSPDGMTAAVVGDRHKVVLWDVDL
jgi:WD40 repeat protein